MYLAIVHIIGMLLDVPGYAYTFSAQVVDQGSAVTNYTCVGSSY